MKKTKQTPTEVGRTFWCKGKVMEIKRPKEAFVFDTSRCQHQIAAKQLCDLKAAFNLPMPRWPFAKSKGDVLARLPGGRRRLSGSAFGLQPFEPLFSGGVSVQWVPAHAACASEGQCPDHSPHLAVMLATPTPSGPCWTWCVNAPAHETLDGPFGC